MNQVVCYSLSRKETSAAYFGSFPALWAFEVHAEGVIVSLARPITHQTPCHNRPLSNGLKAAQRLCTEPSVDAEGKVRKSEFCSLRRFLPQNSEDGPTSEMINVFPDLL